MGSPGDRLRELRNSWGKTQKEISDAIGIKVSFWSDLENNRRPITNKFVAKLNEHFDFDSEWLLNGSGNMYPKNVPSNVPLDFKSQRFSLYDGLSEKELDFLLSIEIEGFRDAFEDYKKLTQAVHYWKGPDFILEKFPVPGSVGQYSGDFKIYRGQLEKELEEDHAHLKDRRQLKVLKITDLYQSNNKHYRYLLSSLIDYIHRYVDFFNDKPSKSV